MSCGVMCVSVVRFFQAGRALKLCVVFLVAVGVAVGGASVFISQAGRVAQV